MYKETKDGVRLFSPQGNTLKELLTHNINYAMEDDEYYYFHEYSEELYDNSYWVVDKKTKELFWTYFTEVIVVYNKAKKINPETLRRAFA